MLLNLSTDPPASPLAHTHPNSGATETFFFLDNHLYFILGTGAGVARQKVLQLKSAKVLPITPITPLTLSLELKHILFFFLTKIADGTKTLVWIKSRHNFFFHENCRWHNNSGGKVEA